MKSYNVPHNDTFNTPDFIFKQLDDLYGFTLDAACDSSNNKVPNAFCYDLGHDGLIESWGGHKVFCNPPFSQKDKWIKKAYEEVYEKDCVFCAMILPLNCMSTIAFYDTIIKNNVSYEVLKGRIQFLSNQTKEIAPNNNSGTVIVYFKKPISTKRQRERNDSF